MVAIWLKSTKWKKKKKIAVQKCSTRRGTEQHSPKLCTSVIDYVIPLHGMIHRYTVELRPLITSTLLRTTRVKPIIFFSYPRHSHTLTLALVRHPACSWKIMEHSSQSSNFCSTPVFKRRSIHKFSPQRTFLNHR